MTVSEPEFSPFECAVDMLKDIETAVGVPVSEFAGFSFKRILITAHPGIETIVPAPDCVFYHVTDETAEHLAVATSGVIEVFELVMHICDSNIWNGVAVPQPFRAICSRRLHGKAAGPKRHGKTPGAEFGLFFSAFVICHYLKDAFVGVPLVRVDGGSKTSAADNFQSALAANGVILKYTQIRDWLSHPKHENNRYRALAVENRLKEILLFQVGVLKHQRPWIVGPYGPYGPIGQLGRMT